MKRSFENQIAPGSSVTNTQASQISPVDGGDRIDDVNNIGTLLQSLTRRFHSDVGSPLAAIGLRLELLRLGGKLDDSSAQAVAEVSAQLEQVVDSVRASMKDLRELETKTRGLMR